MKIKKFGYTQELGWSVSRFDKFTACKRQYYYDYYGGFDNEFGKEKIGELKKLTSLALEAGNITHDVIKTLLERLLKSEKPINRAKFIEYARECANTYCAKKNILRGLLSHKTFCVTPRCACNSGTSTYECAK